MITKRISGAIFTAVLILGFASCGNMQERNVKSSTKTENTGTSDSARIDDSQRYFK